MYQIQPHTKNKAKKLGVVVKPSTKLGKKIDVFEDKVKIASVGALGYGDYATYLQTHGKEENDIKRNSLTQHYRYDQENLNEFLLKMFYFYYQRKEV